MSQSANTQNPVQAATAAEPEAEAVPAEAGTAPASASAPAAEGQPECEPSTSEVYVSVNIVNNVTQTVI